MGDTAVSEPIVPELPGLHIPQVAKLVVSELSVRAVSYTSALRAAAVYGNAAARFQTAEVFKRSLGARLRGHNGNGIISANAHPERGQKSRARSARYSEWTTFTTCMMTDMRARSCMMIHERIAPMKNQ